MRNKLMEYSFRFIAVYIFSFAICGCGSGNSGGVAIEQTCSRCHERQGAEWRQSAHNTKNGASCVACHAPHAGHPNSCNVCHNGQFSGNPNVVPLRNVDIAVSGYRDIKSSNMCLVCHVGSVHSNSIPDPLPPAPNSFIRSDDKTGGVTLYKHIGYHYYDPATTSKYNDPDYYHHDEIGLGDFNGTGILGPCITCHIGQASEGKRHTSMPVDSSGNLMAAVCSKCHNELNAPPPMTTAVLADEKRGYTSALIMLAKVLKERGISYNDSAPNFSYTAWASPQEMGAAFNFNLLWHDYGAYVHNRIYAKRLIFDSIDWALEGTTNGSIEAPALLSVPVGELIFTKADGTAVYYNDTVKAEALNYLQGGVGGARP